MKKTIYFLLMLLPLMGFSACSSDDDLPEVDIIVEFNGLYQSQGQYYAVQSEPFAVVSISSRSINSSAPSAISGVTYYWNFLPQVSTNMSPFTFDIDMSSAAVGLNQLGMSMIIAQTGKPLSYGTLRYRINVVAQLTDLPANAESVTTDIVRVNPDDDPDDIYNHD